VALADVRVLQHHLIARPATELHQSRERRSPLNVPACPCVSEIMPPEPLQARAFDGLVPSRARAIPNRILLALVVLPHESVDGVIISDPDQHLDRILIQGNA